MPQARTKERPKARQEARQEAVLPPKQQMLVNMGFDKRSSGDSLDKNGGDLHSSFSELRSKLDEDVRSKKRKKKKTAAVENPPDNTKVTSPNHPRGDVVPPDDPFNDYIITYSKDNGYLRFMYKSTPSNS